VRARPFKAAEGLTALALQHLTEAKCLELRCWQ
jgi:hypothetical protein